MYLRTEKSLSYRCQYVRHTELSPVNPQRATQLPQEDGALPGRMLAHLLVSARTALARSVLADGINAYLYGIGRWAQYQAETQYFGADGLDSSLSSPERSAFDAMLCSSLTRILSTQSWGLRVKASP